MILEEAVCRWTQVDGENWFISNIAKLTIEIQTAREFRFHDDFEDLLWESVDLLNKSQWSTSSQLTFVELVMDASLLIGGRDLFNEFFDWFEINALKTLHRHKGARVFLNALGSSEELQNSITRCQYELEASLQGDADVKWTSLSIIALVDLAHRYLPLSAALPEILRQCFFGVFEKCDIDWFVDDLFSLNPNSDSWAQERNEIFTLWFNKFLGGDSPNQMPAHSTIVENEIDHQHLVDPRQITLPVQQIISRAKAKYRTFNNQEALWKSLERGTAVISHSAQLDAYLASYGNKHIAKLNHIFQGNYGKISPDRVVDWACGQGIGALALLDRFGKESTLKEIILIEPSYEALVRAEYLVCRHEHIASKSVRSLHGYFDNSTLDNLKFQGNTIHMFSNVLDIESVNIQNTYELICERFTGQQLFFLVSPFISRVRSARLHAFQNMFSDQSNYSEHIQIDNAQLAVGNASITARVFSVILE